MEEESRVPGQDFYLFRQKRIRVIDLLLTHNVITDNKVWESGSVMYKRNGELF